jgi:glycosyltransferase involved in cell wall biosynthesis
LAFSKEIRILQLIDSLEAGGAERMAVSYANALNRNIGFGALVATRTEGALKNLLDENVVYDYLNRKAIFDFKALFLLRRFVVHNKITHLHAHSSSVFFGVILKMILPKINIIWHDHYGKSEMLSQRPTIALQIGSLFVSQIIAVNNKLKNWSQEKLWCKKVTYLPNFTGVSSDGIVDATLLKGEEGKRIICLANLRPQKNHKMLLKVAKKINETNPKWTFHLIGKDFNDAYSKEIKEEIKQFGLINTVFIYGSKQDVSEILKQSSIGVLTSLSEGLPIAILEYGFHKLPVVATSVGEISLVVNNEKEGLLVKSDNVSEFVIALNKIIGSKILQTNFANSLHQKILENYSEEAVIQQYLKCINEK